MPRVRRQVVLEDPARPVTPDMVETKLRMYYLCYFIISLFILLLYLYLYIYICKLFLVKEEFLDEGSLDEVQAQKVAEETPSPHLQDHQYGQTPCYQVTRKPTQPPPRTEVNKTIFTLR